MSPQPMLAARSPFDSMDVAPASPAPPLPLESVSSCDRKESNTVIIFDWDDTLLASSYLSAHGFRLDLPLDNMPGEMKQQLCELEEAVCKLLDLAQLRGQVCIITNAETGWVQLSAAKFLPAVSSLLDRGGIKIVSARSTFEQQFPDSPQQWKLQAFNSQLAAALPCTCSTQPPSPVSTASTASSDSLHSMLSAASVSSATSGVSELSLGSSASANSANNNNNNNSPSSPAPSSPSTSAAACWRCSQQSHVLSFGDSHVEREAAHASTKPLTRTCCKSVKFVERPSIEQLRRELELVLTCFEYICTHPGALDLMLTISLFPAQQPTPATSTPASASAPVSSATSPLAAQPPAVHSQPQPQQVLH